MPNYRWRAFLACVCVATWATSTLAEGTTCPSSYEGAQRLRLKARFQESRAQLIVCNQSCTGALQTDCLKWLDEVDAATPTIVFDVRAASGGDLRQVKVYLDGTLVAAELNGTALPADPGPHMLRFETPTQTVTVQAVLREGEKARSIRVVFPANPPPASRSKEGGKPGSNAASVASIITGAGGVAVAALGAGFEISGLVQRGNLGKCDPVCNPSDVSSARNMSLAGDVLVTSGVGLVVVAAVIYLMTRANHVHVALGELPMVLRF